MKYLVDTNILSEARRSGGHPAVRAKLASINDGDLYLSVVTVGEIARGIARLPAGRRRKSLQEWFSQTERHFADRLLPVTAAVAHHWGELSATLEKAGRTLPVADGLIAATALHFGLRVITRNASDFSGTGVLVTNPLDEV